MSESIQERISAIQEVMAAGNPTPSQVRNFEMRLCGLLGSFAKEAVLAEVEFKKVIAASRIGAKSMAEAKAIAETQPAYARFLEAKADHECCHQMLMTSRSHSRSLSEEMRLQR
jgi:D-ribose pyranose/furanose isomerase RbsD